MTTAPTSAEFAAIAIAAAEEGEEFARQAEKAARALGAAHAGALARRRAAMDAAEMAFAVCRHGTMADEEAAAAADHAYQRALRASTRAAAAARALRGAAA